jgi:hypothetical protein
MSVFFNENEVSSVVTKGVFNFVDFESSVKGVCPPFVDFESSVKGVCPPHHGPC